MDRDDRYAAGVGSPAAPRMAQDESAASLRVKRRKGGEGGYTVVSDLPDTLPVSEAELDLLEHVLGPEIAAMLRR